jgi:ribosome-associated protein
MAKARAKTTGGAKGQAPRKAPKRTRAPKAPRARARSVKAEPDPSREKALKVAALGLDKKALDVVVLDVRGLASYAEYFVIMTAESDPQLDAIAENIEAGLRQMGERPMGVEGAHGGRWVLLDYGDVVAHVFYQDTRAFYDIEGLWADAPRVLLPP